jgi:hypothetical protein
LVEKTLDLKTEIAKIESRIDSKVKIKKLLIFKTYLEINTKNMSYYQAPNIFKIMREK